MKILKLLLIPILFFACESKEDDCLVPVCPRPFVDVLFTFDDSFSTNELSEVIVIKKAKGTGDVITSSVIDDIDDTNLGNFYLGTFDINYMEGRQADFFYEIQISTTGDLYILDNFLLDTINSTPCFCGEFILKSLEINDELITQESATILLKK